MQTLALLVLIAVVLILLALAILNAGMADRAQTALESTEEAKQGHRLSRYGSR